MIPSGFLGANAPSLQVNTNLQRRSSTVSLATPNAEEFVTGFDAVRSQQKYHGFCADHIRRMIAFAAEKNVVIAFRPVNPLATSLIEDGYPTKGLEVKGKSAEWGPQAGFIPVDQSLSKAKDIGAANSAVQSCIEQGHAVAVPLELPLKRIRELIGEGLISFAENKNAKTFNIKSEVKFGPAMTFTGTISDDTPPKYKVMQDGKPLMVLGKVGGPKGGMPLTADYDILMFAPHISEYGPEDMPKSSMGRRGSAISVASELSASGKSGLAALMQRNNSIDSSSESSFANKGTLSQRLMSMIPEINQALGREVGNELVHHGADTSNPFTDMKANVPCIAFTPPGVAGIDGVALSITEPGLRHLFKLVKDANYQFFGNDQWDHTLVSNRYGLGGSFMESPSSAASGLRRRGSMMPLDSLDSPGAENLERRPSAPLLMRKTSSHQFLDPGSGSSGPAFTNPFANAQPAPPSDREYAPWPVGGGLNRRPSGLLMRRANSYQPDSLPDSSGPAFTNPFSNARQEASVANSSTSPAPTENLGRRPSGLASLPARKPAFYQTDLEPVPGSSAAESFTFTNPFPNAQPQAQDQPQDQPQAPAAERVPDPNDDMAVRRGIRRPVFVQRASYKQEGTDPKSNE